MEIAKLQVSGTLCHELWLLPIPCGIVGATVSIRYIDPEWQTLRKVIVFQSDITKDVADTGGPIPIPPEVVQTLGAELKIGITGVDANNNVKIPTLWASLGRIQSAADPSEDTETDPCLPFWAQIQAAAEEAKAGVEALRGSVRNLLDNSDFTRPIAQAGVGGFHGTQAYALDRWILDEGMVSLRKGVGLTLNGTIRQKLEVLPTGAFSGFVDMVSGTAQIAYRNGAVTISSQNGVLRWAALYGGSYTSQNRPTYLPKGQGAELTECLRYYYQIPAGASFCHAGFLLNQEEGCATIQTPIPMRAMPSLAVEDLTQVRLYADREYPVTGIQAQEQQGSAVALGYTGSFDTPAHGAVLRFGGKAALLADL